MKPAVLLLAALVASPLLATTADVSIKTLTADRTQLTTGERFNLTILVRNDGPDSVGALITLQHSHMPMYLQLAAPGGWRCTEHVQFSDDVSCFSTDLVPGEEQQMRVLLLAPRTIDGRPYTISARATTAFEDPNRDNDSRSITLPIGQSDNVVDLTLTEPTGTKVVAPDSVVQLDFTVSNRGPGVAPSTILRLLFFGIDPNAVTIAQTGWNCSPSSPQQVTCIRSNLAANESSNVRLRFVAPLFDTNIQIVGTVTAERVYEPDPTNNHDSATFGVGSAESWHRVLIPVTATGVGGALGSMWNTDITMLFLADEEPEVRPHPCKPVPFDCYAPPAPLRRPFQARDHWFLITQRNEPGGQFFYIKREDVSQVRFNARVYDTSRAEETAGSEIPIVREQEFTSDTIALLDVPVAPQYRHMLRIYDDKARDQTQVVIRLYVGDEAEPRATATRTLSVPENAPLVTTVFLPTRPAYTQLDLRELTSLDGAKSVRVEVAPVEPNVKLWAFVSITNNDTHHVTIVTPQ